MNLTLQVGVAETSINPQMGMQFEDARRLIEENPEPPWTDKTHTQFK